MFPYSSFCALSRHSSTAWAPPGRSVTGDPFHPPIELGQDYEFQAFLVLHLFHPFFSQGKRETMGDHSF